MGSPHSAWRPRTVKDGNNLTCRLKQQLELANEADQIYTDPTLYPYNLRLCLGIGVLSIVLKLFWFFFNRNKTHKLKVKTHRDMFG